MRFFYLVCCFLICLPSKLFGQAKLKAVNLHISFDGSVGETPAFTVNDFANEVTSSSFPTFFNMDSLKLQPRQYLINLPQFINSSGYSASLGFYFYSKKQKNYNPCLEWQVGVFYQYSDISDLEYDNGNGPPLLLPSAPDTNTFIDVTYGLRRRFLGISNAFTFRSNPNLTRVSILGGAAFKVGMGVGGELNENYSKNVTVSERFRGVETLSSESLNANYSLRTAILYSYHIYYT